MGLRSASQRPWLGRVRPYGGLGGQASAGGLWTPAEITTKTWLDASTDDADYITETANEVSQWDDRSGENAHQLQASASLQGSIGDYTIGGKRTVYFDGTERMQAASNPLSSPFTKAFTLVVMKIINVGAGGSLFTLTDGVGISNRYRPHCPWSDGNIYFDVSSFRTSGASGWSNNDEAVVGFETDTNLSEIHLDGASLASSANSAAVTPSGGIIIGSDVAYSQNVALGEFIVVEGGISTDDRQKLEGYAAHKWGLAGNLDAGHPYKSSAPTV